MLELTHEGLVKALNSDESIIYDAVFSMPEEWFTPQEVYDRLNEAGMLTPGITVQAIRRRCREWSSMGRIMRVNDFFFIYPVASKRFNEGYPLDYKLHYHK